MNKVVSLFIIFSLSLLADDIYSLRFDHNSQECKLTRNGVEIPFFDKKFKMEAPKSPYICFSIQKVQYKDCKIIKKKNITAFLLSYGSYEYTNSIISFQNINKYYDSLVKIKCSKKKYYDNSK